MWRYALQVHTDEGWETILVWNGSEIPKQGWGFVLTHWNKVFGANVLVPRILSWRPEHLNQEPLPPLDDPNEDLPF